MLAKKKALKASVKTAKKTKKAKKKSSKAAGKAAEKAGKKQARKIAKKKPKAEVKKAPEIEALSGQVAPAGIAAVQRPAVAAQKPAAEAPAIEQVARVSPEVLAAQEAERKKREEQILIELRRRILTGETAQPKPLPVVPRPMARQQPKIIKPVTKPTFRRFPFGRPEPVKPVQKPAVQVQAKPVAQSPELQKKPAVQPISGVQPGKPVFPQASFKRPAAMPAVAGNVQPRPSGIPKRPFLKQKTAVLQRPAVPLSAKEQAANEEILRRRILGRPETGPSAKEIFEKRKPPEKPDGSGKAIYAVIAFLLIVVVGVGLILLLTLSGPGGPFGQGQDENNDFVQAMPEEMASALEKSRFSEIAPAESNESIPQGLVSADETDGKFVDSTGMLSVSFSIEENGSAEIGSISGLTEGRITVVPSGDYSLQLRDSEGIVLYELPFNAFFVVLSNPPTRIEKLDFTFVLPSKKGGEVIAVTHKGVLLTEKEIG